MFAAAAAAILISLALAVTRAIKGPTVFDRVLAGKQWAAFGYIAAEVDRARMD